MSTKRCTRCGNVKPLSEFHKNAHIKDKRQCLCKLCVTEYMRDYRKAHREYFRRYHVEYYHANIEKLRPAHTNCSRAHKKEARQIYLRHKREGKRKWWDSQYSQSEKGRLTQRRANSKRRARLASCELNDLTSTQIAKLLDEALICALCQELFSTEYRKKKSLDHIIPLSKDGNNTLANAQIVHIGCNSEKSDKLQ